MSFSVSAYQAKRRTWTLEIDGRSWIAKKLSAEVVSAYSSRLLAASTSDGWRLVLRLLRLAFPWRPSFLWRGDPVREFGRVIRVAPDRAIATVNAFFPLLLGVAPESETIPPARGS